MSRLRYLTAGESHGPGLTAVLDGCPAGLAVDPGAIDAELRRRQSGYGRGERQSIEQDSVRVLGGVRHGRTTGAPISLFVPNRDAANWGDALAVEAPAPGQAATEPVLVPRPGHADLGGALLYGLDDIRDVIERASARETAAKVACGAVAKSLLAELGCTVASHVVAIGPVTTDLGMSSRRRRAGGSESGPLSRCGGSSLDDDGDRRSSGGRGHARRCGRGPRLRVSAGDRHLRARRSPSAIADSPGPCCRCRRSWAWTSAWVSQPPLCPAVGSTTRSRTIPSTATGARAIAPAASKEACRRVRRSP